MTTENTTMEDMIMEDTNPSPNTNATEHSEDARFALKSTKGSFAS